MYFEKERHLKWPWASCVPGMGVDPQKQNKITNAASLLNIAHFDRFYRKLPGIHPEMAHSLAFAFSPTKFFGCRGGVGGERLGVEMA